MTVAELIAALQSMDPDATVLIATQPNWPFENTVAGVTTRADIDADEDDEDEDTVNAHVSNGTRPNDVLLCEGRQLRYGNPRAWASF